MPASTARSTGAPAANRVVVDGGGACVVDVVGACVVEVVEVDDEPEGAGAAAGFGGGGVLLAVVAVELDEVDVLVEATVVEVEGAAALAVVAVVAVDAVVGGSVVPVVEGGLVSLDEVVDSGAVVVVVLGSGSVTRGRVVDVVLGTTRVEVVVEVSSVSRSNCSLSSSVLSSSDASRRASSSAQAAAIRANAMRSAIHVRVRVDWLLSPLAIVFSSALVTSRCRIGCPARPHATGPEHGPRMYRSKRRPLCYGLCPDLSSPPGSSAVNQVASTERHQPSGINRAA
ncbi:MAG: hypothetical protein AAF467_26180 [Actinomycetota bacterium]